MVISHSPGRINIIGEHTDYNNGFVLPAAIDRKSTFRLKRNNTPSTAHFKANDIGETYTIDLTNFHPIDSGWENYVMGVVHELQQLGAKLTGFDAEFEGDVPIGSGMSSSASLECSLAYGLNELFDLDFDKWQLIKACQMAEHNFVGIKCGIMDQFASMMGRQNHAMLLDCRSLEFDYFPIELDDYELLLLNSNVTHSLASSEYNHRRADCEEGVAMIQSEFPAIQSLRDVSFDILQQVADILPQRIKKRCQHIVSENHRVLTATKALSNKDFRQLGQLLYQSHFSLQNDYEVSCTELDYLVQETLDQSCILGSRMMGGGFGGCTINIIESKQREPFIETITQKYKHHFGIEVTPYLVAIGNGSSIESSKFHSPNDGGSNFK